MGDIAAVACRDALGCWGWIEAYRDCSDRPFDDDDLELLASAGSSLSRVLRRGCTVAAPGTACEPAAPGVIVLNPDLSVVSRTAGARAWIDAMPAAGLFAAWGILPPVVYPVATRAREGEAAAGARALDRGVDGRWAVVEAASLEGDGTGKIAVTLRAAAPAETFGLLCRAYALTHRERNVVTALVAGLDTRAVTEQLVISRHTVQDHLKSVFDKVGVRSRRELLATFSAPDDRRSRGQATATPRPGEAEPGRSRAFDRVTGGRHRFNDAWARCRDSRQSSSQEPAGENFDFDDAQQMRRRLPGSSQSSCAMLLPERSWPHSELAGQRPTTRRQQAIGLTTQRPKALPDAHVL
jgi:DNA-binding CsgD family transcriptional regulator